MASPADAADVIDAVSGLVGDFHRLTIFLNGLRKYVIEGWRLR